MSRDVAVSLRRHRPCYRPGMTTMVQVYECEEGSRRPTHRLPIGKLMTHAIERLSANDVVQLRNDLTVLGRARVSGAGGRWHEYVLTGG